uniref:Uncharacterized protein n=1 Tax=Arundo donax TaxID=35708 RepID=A0A0A9AM19_ARUDO
MLRLMNFSRPIRIAEPALTLPTYLSHSFHSSLDFSGLSTDRPTSASAHATVLNL